MRAAGAGGDGEGRLGRAQEQDEGREEAQRLQNVAPQHVHVVQRLNGQAWPVPRDQRALLLLGRRPGRLQR